MDIYIDLHLFLPKYVAPNNHFANDVSNFFWDNDVSNFAGVLITSW